MTINPIPTDLVHLLSAGRSGTSRALGASDGGFANVLSDAFANASQLDAADKASGLELLLAESDDLSGIMIDVQKAELSLNLAIQIRNKIVDSYNEIIRMQV